MSFKKQLPILLKRLKRGPLTVREAYEELGIGSPSRRICDLKQLGYKIRKQYYRVENQFGDQVKIVKYFLV